MDLTASRHRRSKSDFTKCMNEEDKLNIIFRASQNLNFLDTRQPKSGVEDNNRPLPGPESQNLSKEEILLQEQVKDKFMSCCVQERASNYKTLWKDNMKRNLETKPAEDLIKEIAVLELEVVHLEKYLLSMYQKTFDNRVLSFASVSERAPSNAAAQQSAAMEVPEHSTTSKNKSSMVNNSSISEEAILGTDALIDSSIFRSHSSISQRSASSFRTQNGKLAEAADSYHSLPLSMLELCQCSASNARLAMDPGNSLHDHFPETPNRLSEEIIMCISAIYCQLADPPLFNYGFPSSPVSLSSSSSMTGSSPQGENDIWSSSHCRENSSFCSGLKNPFHIEGLLEFNGSHVTMFEVQGICRDSHELKGVEGMLQTFRGLISRLEDVDPRKLKHEEKLAFWINVHNTLVMHAFLVYGIPRGNLKRVSLLGKAAYNVGGHTVTVGMIQRSILECRLPRPGQWFQSLFFPKTKFKAGDARKAYAIGNPEPLLLFALCSGCHSDPAVRLYTAKRVFQELQMAKEEYIETNIRAKEQKIYLPKIVESFGKEMGLCPDGLEEMIELSMPDSLRKNFQQQQQKQKQKQKQGKFWKKIEWLPHRFSFRFLLSSELFAN